LKSITSIYSKLLDRVPTGAVSATQGITTKEGNAPFSVREENGKLFVYLPKNLESLGDSQLAIVAVASIRALGAEVRCSEDDSELDHLDKKVQMYCSGVAWALSYKEGQALHPFQEVTGSLGHGFYWVAHTAMATKYRSAWWAKGTPWHMTRGLTGKVWDNALKPDTKRIISLAQRAAKTLDCSESWRSYFRSRESFLGSELKRSLPHLRVGIITQGESDYFAQIHSKAIAQYDSMCEWLASPTEEKLPTLSEDIKSVGRSLQSLEILCDKIVSSRVNVIYPSNKKERKLALKRPIEELISEMSIEDYVPSFDPSAIKMKRRFDLPPHDNALTFEQNLDQARRDYEIRVKSLRKQGDILLADLCSNWADTAICPLEI
jgi:hypothetical protein